ALSISGGTGSYSFVWSNGNTTATATGLTAGNYPFTVTDNAGCSVNGMAVVDADFCCTLAISAEVTNGSCNLDNALITVNITSDGTAPYTYSLNNGTGQASNIFNNLSAGNYSVTARDINGCEHTV